MTPTDRDKTLSQWIKPSSESEQDRQERAVRMVEDAIDAYEPLHDVSKSIYAKGSYPNNTNVRLDSDVDVVVQCAECLYYDHSSGVTPPSPGPPSYQGGWNPTAWRSAVTAALRAWFGTTEIDDGGSVAILVKEKIGSRPSADVVPSFDFRRYTDTAHTAWHSGSTVFPKSSQTKIINWPSQQLENGKTKNQQSGYRYKRFVRALKNAENVLSADGVIAPKPSYLMECLVYNVPDATLQTGTLSEGFEATLLALYSGLTNGTCSDWVEPNRLKWALRSGQKWSQADALELVSHTWSYLYQ